MYLRTRNEFVQKGEADDEDDDEDGQDNQGTATEGVSAAGVGKMGCWKVDKAAASDVLRLLWAAGFCAVVLLTGTLTGHTDRAPHTSYSGP